MNTFHNAERARVQQVAAEKRAAEAAAAAAAETSRQEAAARKLLGAIDPTYRSLAQLADQERQLTEHFRAGRIEATAYASALTESERGVMSSMALATMPGPLPWLSTAWERLSVECRACWWQA